MSRTFKDRPYRVAFPPTERYQTFGWVYLEPAGVKTKKRKAVDTECHWMTTPGWWIRLMMGKPQRREVKLWERQAVTTRVQDLEELDTPHKKVPFVYYW